MKTIIEIEFNNAEGDSPQSTLRFEHHEECEVHSGDMLTILRTMLNIINEDTLNAGATITHTVED